MPERVYHLDQPNKYEPEKQFICPFPNCKRLTFNGDYSHEFRYSPEHGFYCRSS